MCQSPSFPLVTRPKPLFVISLINAATIAFGTPPFFTRFAPQQPSFSTAIANVVLELPGLVDSVDSTANGEKVLEWGSMEPGVRIKSGETWHDRA